MKILSVAIPCYNSESYMKRCIDSLLEGGQYMDIMIIDDGSTDGTAAIADDYQEKYPDTVRAIHQENRGHGGAVNTGIANAAGRFFKVVDSDDWVDEESLLTILSFLNKVIKSHRDLDMLLSNFVYEKEGARHKFVMRPKGLPENTFFKWEAVRNLRKFHFFLMHSVIYRTELLRDMGMELPEHTFYVDNLYVFEPLPFVKNMYYINTDFYRYFIGRNDQSVNEPVMIKRMDQQYNVNKIMYTYYCDTEITDPDCRKYMLNYLDIITTISCVLANLDRTPESLEKRRRLWQFFRDTDPVTYRKLRYRMTSFWMNLPGLIGHKMGSSIYRWARRFIGFN